MDFNNIEYYDDKVILKNTKNFNIKQTFECGQCFRWEKVNENDFIGVAYGKVIEVEQNGDTITIYNTNKEDFHNIWLKYFDLERDYSKIKEKLSKDALLKSSVE
ncbi:MAG: DNA glycosylase, partial [Sarcina sp.]